MCVVSSTSDYLRVCTANAISDSNKWQVLRNFLMVAITAKHLRSSIAWVCSSFLTTSQIHWDGDGDEVRMGISKQSWHLQTMVCLHQVTMGYQSSLGAYEQWCGCISLGLESWTAIRCY